MATYEQLNALGQILRQRRKELGLTLQEVENRSQVGVQYLSNIERGYVNPKRGPSIPGDDILKSLADTLDLPIRDLHAALGRIPPGSPAAALVRETLAGYETAIDLTPEQFDALIGEIEDYAEYQLTRTVRQSQSQSQSGDGKQTQRQKQEIA